MTADEALGLAILVIFAIVVGYLVLNVRAERKLKREDRRQRAQWKSAVEETGSGPIWEQDDWPETGLARYLDAATADRPAWDGTDYDVPVPGHQDAASWLPQFYQAPDQAPAPAFIPATGPQPLLMAAPVSDTGWQPVFSPPPAPVPVWQPLSEYRVPTPPLSDADLFIAMITARTDAHIATMRSRTDEFLALPSADRLAVTA